MAFSSLEAKLCVLRAKYSLKHSREFARVFLRSSKSHTERLIEINFRKLLDIVPGGEELRVASNGRIIEKDAWSGDQESTGLQGTKQRQRGCGRRGGRGRGRGSYVNSVGYLHGLHTVQQGDSANASCTVSREHKRRRQATGTPERDQEDQQQEADDL